MEVNNTDNKYIFDTALRQSAIDLSCDPTDFLKKENVIVESQKHTNARRYLTLPFDCNLVTYGNNIVASVSPRLRDTVLSYINMFPLEHCFETPNMHILNDKVSDLGYKICFMAEYFLPDVNDIKIHKCAFETRILEKRDFVDLYKKEWSNALCEKRKDLDMLCVGAYDNRRLIGLAGASADCEDMWQIGIDIDPEYRRNGIAASLVSTLTSQIIKRGKVPFYCAAWSNIASVRTAIKCGFKPSWCELTIKNKDSVDEMNNVR